MYDFILREQTKGLPKGFGKTFMKELKTTKSNPDIVCVDDLQNNQGLESWLLPS